LNGEDAAKSDMICGGSGDVLLVFLPWDDPETTLVFEKALDAAVGNQEGWLITQFRENGVDTNKFCFVDRQGEKTGNLIINGEFLSDMRGTPDQIAIHSDFLLNSEILVEKIKERTKLYIFGGGHVAKETARLADEVSFETIVLDDRAEFANKERFPNSKIMVVPDYKSLPDLPIDHQSFVVILTRGHLGDYDVLKEMLKTDAFYIGMIGSIHKRNLIYERLLNEGVSQKEIDRVHSPIGLPINGETPTEIAISIIAELILERSKLK
jgi:xanthine dehydrogenase accessory factor